MEGGRGTVWWVLTVAVGLPQWYVLVHYERTKDSGAKKSMHIKLSKVINVK